VEELLLQAVVKEEVLVFEAVDFGGVVGEVVGWVALVVLWSGWRGCSECIERSVWRECRVQ
jgi:hypothetical protein